MTVQKFPVAIRAGFGGLQAAPSLVQSGKDVMLIVGVASPLENRYILVQNVRLLTLIWRSIIHPFPPLK